MKYAAFISHANSDGAKALQVAEQLERAGIKCWIAPRDLQTGQSYREAIVHALRETKCLILLLSEAANTSDWVPNEVDEARNLKRRIYTLRIENIEPGDGLRMLISQYQRLDAYSGSFKSHVDLLIQHIVRDFASQGDESIPTSVLDPQPAGFIQRFRWLMVVGAAALVLIAAFFGFNHLQPDAPTKVVTEDPVHQGGVKGQTKPPASRAHEEANAPSTETNEAAKQPTPPPPTAGPTSEQLLTAAFNECEGALGRISPGAVLDLISVTRVMEIKDLLSEQVQALLLPVAERAVNLCENPEFVDKFTSEQRTQFALALIRIGKSGRADRLLDRASNDGESWAKFVLGLRELSKLNLSRDQYYRAERLILSSGNDGNKSAKLVLGLLYVSYGQEFGSESRKGLALIAEVADHSYPLAKFMLGYYYSGLVPKFDDLANTPVARRYLVAAEALGFELPPDAKLLAEPSANTSPAPAPHAARLDPYDEVARRATGAEGVAVSGQLQVTDRRKGKLHAMPNRQSPILKMLEPGTVLNVRKLVSGNLWYRVEDNAGVTGFVFKADLEELSGERVSATDRSTYGSVPTGRSVEVDRTSSFNSESYKKFARTVDRPVSSTDGVLTVKGAVRNPGIHPLNKAVTVKNALKLAGGLLATADAAAIEVIRKNGDERRINARPSTVIKPGDTLIIHTK